MDGGSGADSIRGDAGDDTVIITDWTEDTLVDGGDDSDTLNLTGVAGLVTLDLGNDSRFLNFENVMAGDGGAVLTGTAAANRLEGGAGDDTLSGGAGNDKLFGRDGYDILSGGSGNDTLEGVTATIFCMAALMLMCCAAVQASTVSISAGRHPELALVATRSAVSMWADKRSRLRLTST
nr:calcium-binding protein [Hankyongella ginsenosidimutans]